MSLVQAGTAICGDNAAESFFSSLRREQIRKRIYKTRCLAKACLRYRETPMHYSGAPGFTEVLTAAVALLRRKRDQGDRTLQNALKFIGAPSVAQ
jgi:hypothetical protein